MHIADNGAHKREDSEEGNSMEECGVRQLG